MGREIARKPPYLWGLCQTKASYRAMWDQESRARSLGVPVQLMPANDGRLRLGDAVALMTDAVGIKQTKSCGCKERQVKWNRYRLPLWLSVLVLAARRVIQDPRVIWRWIVSLTLYGNRIRSTVYPALRSPRSEYQMVDVVTLFSGRQYCFRRWFKSLLSLDYPRRNLRLIWYTNSRSRWFLARLRLAAWVAHWRGFAAILLTHDTTLQPSRNSQREMIPGEAFPKDHCEVIAALYNRALERTGRDVLFWEDDIVVEPDALMRLLADAREHAAGYLTAVVRDRHAAQYFLWNLKTDDGYAPLPVDEHEAGAHPIGLGPLGFSFVTREAFDRLSRPIMKPYMPKEWDAETKLHGCDMVMCVEMERLGIKRLCDWSVRAKHYDSKGVAH